MSDQDLLVDPKDLRDGEQPPKDEYGRLLFGYRKITGKVRDDAEDTGLRDNTRPGDQEPKSPTGLMGLSDRELGDLLDEFGEWYDYLSREVGAMQSEILPLERQLKLTKAYLLHRQLQGAKKEREEQVLLEEAYVVMDQRYTEAKAKLIFAEARLTVIGNTLRRISRHIAMRQEQEGFAQRRQNVGGYRRPPYDTSFLPPSRVRVEDDDE